MNAKLFAPANNAERCAVTHWGSAITAHAGYWFLTGITDAAAEGVWLGPDGEAIDPAYLNWATDEPDNGNGGTAENCVAYKDNEAYDVNCAAVPTERFAWCVVRPPPAA